MEPKSPEIESTASIALLTKEIAKVPGFGKEITVRGDNLGVNKWQEMVSATQTDGRERGLNVFYNPLTKRFTPGNIVTGGERNFKTGADTPVDTSDIGLKGIFSNLVASIHTHPLVEESAHLKTSVPSGNDIRAFLNHSYSAMVVIDKGGSHLIVRTREKIDDELPSSDLVQRKIDEVAVKNGTVSDVQKQLNSMISQYGLEYFYTDCLVPAENGTITFRKP